MIEPKKNQGYWQVGDKLFSTKVQALIEAQKTDSWPTFYYNDKWWDAHDWSVEPTESLKELYLRRAQQLREKYDTIIIRYSGGGDSLNILKTFLDNNIKIDVVVTNEYYQVENLDRSTDIGSLEKIKVAYPTLDRLQAEGHQFQRLDYDISIFVEQVLSDSEWWLKTNSPRFRATEIAAPRACLHPDLSKYNRPGTAIVMGLDKPHIDSIQDQIWYCFVNDNIPCVLPDASWSNFVPEPFYWSADMPDLPCKQAHVFKNWVKNSENTKLLGGKSLDDKINKKYAYALLYGDALEMKVGDPVPFFQVEDVVDITTDGNSPRNILADRWIENSRLTPQWKAGIQAADDAIHSRYKTHNTIWEAGLIGLRSKKRWLGY